MIDELGYIHTCPSVARQVVILISSHLQCTHASCFVFRREHGGLRLSLRFYSYRIVSRCWRRCGPLFASYPAQGFVEFGITCGPCRLALETKRPPVLHANISVSLVSLTSCGRTAAHDESNGLAVPPLSSARETGGLGKKVCSANRRAEHPVMTRVKEHAKSQILFRVCL